MTTRRGRLGLLRALAAVAVLATLACGAPRAELIEGDVATVVERGLREGQGRFDHDDWDAILRDFLHDGGRRFDYAGLKREESRLEAYLGRLAAAELDALGRDELLAFFVNAYNAYTVATVLEHVDADGTVRIESIRDIPDVFGRKVHVVGGFTLSLDNIEHNILRPVFKDPRVHFAVNCASASCPPLPPHALVGARVDAQLDEAARTVLSDPDYVRVEDDRLLVTRILDWYGADFVTPGYRGAEASLPAYVRKYTRPEVREWIDARPEPPPVEFLPYEWSLNRWSP